MCNPRAPAGSWMTRLWNGVAAVLNAVSAVVIWHRKRRADRGR